MRLRHQELAVDASSFRVEADEQQGLNVSSEVSYFVHGDPGGALLGKTVYTGADCREGNAPDV